MTPPVTPEHAFEEVEGAKSTYGLGAGLARDEPRGVGDEVKA
jgi:hypothetical protein